MTCVGHSLSRSNPVACNRRHTSPSRSSRSRSGCRRRWRCAAGCPVCCSRCRTARWGKRRSACSSYRARSLPGTYGPNRTGPGRPRAIRSGSGYRSPAEYISSARPICRMFDAHIVCRAFSRAWANTGNRRAASIAIIAITTSKLDERERSAALPRPGRTSAGERGAVPLPRPEEPWCMVCADACDLLAADPRGRGSRADRSVAALLDKLHLRLSAAISSAPGIAAFLSLPHKYSIVGSDR